MLVIFVLDVEVILTELFHIFKIKSCTTLFEDAVGFSRQRMSQLSDF